MEVKIFYCYAHEDKKLRMELEKHLRNLEQQKLITGWSDCNINAGSVWVSEISSNLDIANIILLLISKDFMNSTYCTSIEMKRALERHENGTAKVIPIILRHGDYEGALFSHLQALPTDAVPITHRKWRNQDEAFLDVAKGIRKVVKELLSEDLVYEGNIHFYRQQYNEALAAFEKAIFHNSSNALALTGKGQTLNELAFNSRGRLESDEQYKDAIKAFEKAIEIEPTNSFAYAGKGKALLTISAWGESKDALSSYEQAIKLDSQNEAAYIGQGDALRQSFRPEEALVAFEKAINVAPFPNQYAYIGKIKVLYSLERYEELIVICEQTIRVFPEMAFAYEILGHALYNTFNYEAALTAFEKAISFGCESDELYHELGYIYFQLGHEQEALVAFERAIETGFTPSKSYKGKGNVLKYLAEQAFKKAEEAEEHPF